MGFFSSSQIANIFYFDKKKIFEQIPKDFLNNTYNIRILALPTADGCTPTEPLPLGSGTKMKKKIGAAKPYRLILSIVIIYCTIAEVENRGDAIPVVIFI